LLSFALVTFCEQKFGKHGWVPGKVVEIKKTKITGKYTFHVQFTMTMQLSADEMKQCRQVTVNKD